MLHGPSDSEPNRRRLVVAAHWTDDPDALDKVAEAYEPLKAPGTEGVAILYRADDPMAAKTYKALREAVVRP